MNDLKITSPAFSMNGPIPSHYTCDGEDVNPPLLIENLPPGTQSLALIVDDPDAPARHLGPLGGLEHRPGNQGDRREYPAATCPAGNE